MTDENQEVEEKLPIPKHEFVRIDVQRPQQDQICIVRSHGEDNWPSIMAYVVKNNGEESWYTAEGDEFEVNNADEWMYCPR